MLSDLLELTLLIKQWHGDLNPRSPSPESVLWTAACYYQYYREIVINEQ